MNHAATKPEIQADAAKNGVQAWAHRMADLYEDQQRKDKIIAEGREAAIKLRYSVIAGGLTNNISIK